MPRLLILFMVGLATSIAIAMVPAQYVISWKLLVIFGVGLVCGLVGGYRRVP